MRQLDIDCEQDEVWKELRDKRAAALTKIDIAFHTDEGEKEEEEKEITRKRMNRKVKQELLKTSVFSGNDRTDAEKKLWDLTLEDRWRLYRTWAQDYVGEHQRQLEDEKENYFQYAQRLEELREMENLYILRSAKVVGMTTTGGARLHSLLKKLKPTIYSFTV